MDIISSYQLRQYDEILAEINSEFERSERLKREIQEADNTITFLKLSVSLSQKKISHVNVKIFGSITEIENLYDELGDCHNEFDASKCNNCNFFLIEVILTKTLLAKLVDTRWRLQIVIRTEEKFCKSKVVMLNEKKSMLEVIPVDNNVYECVVDVYLIYSYENDWITLDIFSVNVDISYYFEAFKDKNSCNSLADSFLKISKLYNDDKNLHCARTLPILQNQIKCSFDKHDFVPIFVRNSYHRLNLESFSEVINDNRRVIELQFAVSNNKVIVLYHKDTHILKLKCTPCIIQMVRNLFEKNLSSILQDFKAKLKKIKNKKNELEEMDLDEILTFYHQVRRIWL